MVGRHAARYLHLRAQPPADDRPVWRDDPVQSRLRRATAVLVAAWGGDVDRARRRGYTAMYSIGRFDRTGHAPTRQSTLEESGPHMITVNT